MAAFEVDFPDDFIQDLLQSDFDEIAEEALKEASPVLVKSLQQSCRRVIVHPGDSDLVKSFKSSKPKKSVNGAWIANVNPKGKSKTSYYAKSNGKKTQRKYAVSNALKALWKEYGVAGRQPAMPFIQNGTKNAENGVMEKMQQVYNRKVGAE